MLVGKLKLLAESRSADCPGFQSLRICRHNCDCRHMCSRTIELWKRFIAQKRALLQFGNTLFHLHLSSYPSKTQMPQRMFSWKTHLKWINHRRASISYTKKKLHTNLLFTRGTNSWRRAVSEFMNCCCRGHNCCLHHPRSCGHLVTQRCLNDSHRCCVHNMNNPITTKKINQ